MSAKTHYAQCTMERRDGTAIIRHVAWIPSSFAKVGRHLDLKIGDDWSGPWVVAERGGTMESDACEVKSREYKHAYASIEGSK